MQGIMQVLDAGYYAGINVPWWLARKQSIELEVLFIDHDHIAHATFID